MSTRTNAVFRVVHLSTSHAGGAGIAARRLNRLLNERGIPSVFYSISKRDFVRESNEFTIVRSLATRIKGLPALWISKFLTNVSFFSLFSAPAISNAWLEDLARQESTIVHIHNWFNLLSQKQLRFLISSGARVVLTMHDQRLMTGGCHYALNCEGFKSGCNSCPITPSFLKKIPSKNAKGAFSIFNASANKVSVISPSKFLQREASESFILSRVAVKHVPNQLPSDFAQNRHNGLNSFRGTTYVVGIASMDPFDLIKGGDLIQKVISGNLAAENGLAFLMLADFTPEKHVDFWQSVDCLLVPSRADNSPNVIHEAKALGIPIITTDVGGIPELLSAADFAIPIEKLSVEAIFDAITAMRARDHSGDIAKASEESFRNYTGEAMEKLEKVYLSLIS